MTQQTKKRVWFNVINFSLFTVLILLHYNPLITIAIGKANPMAPLALLVAMSFFCGETTACFSGLIMGILVDSMASTKSFFNMIVFFMIGLFVTLIVRFLFNNNIRSCVAVCAISGVFYFVARWLCFFAFSIPISQSFRYLFAYAFPSAIYTTVFAIPFYYLQKFLFKRLY